MTTCPQPHQHTQYTHNTHTIHTQCAHPIHTLRRRTWVSQLPGKEISFVFYLVYELTFWTQVSKTSVASFACGPKSLLKLVSVVNTWKSGIWLRIRIPDFSQKLDCQATLNPLFWDKTISQSNITSSPFRKDTCLPHPLSHMGSGHQGLIIFLYLSPLIWFPAWF